MSTLELIGTPEGPAPASWRRTLARWSAAPLVVLGAGTAASGATWPAVAIAGLAALTGWLGLRDGRSRLKVRADSEALVVDDPDTGTRVALQWSTLRAVRLVREAAAPPAAQHGRPSVGRLDFGDDADRVEVLLVLTDHRGLSVSLRLRHEPDLPSPLPEVERAALGELVGVPTPATTAPGLARQIVDDPTGQLAAHVARHAPARATTRLALRTWMSPPHGDDAPHGELVLDGDTWRAVDPLAGAQRGLLLLPRVQRAGPPDSVRVDLGPTDDGASVVAVSFAAPALAAGLRAPVDAAASSLWLDPHDGALLLAHILTRGPESTWPAALRQRLGVVRGAEAGRAAMRPPEKPAAGETGARG